PHSLPRVEGWEAGLGSHDLSGLRVAVDPRMGRAVVHPEVEAIVLEAAEALIKAAGLRPMQVAIEFPDAGPIWGLANLPAALGTFHKVWPDRADELTDELRMGLGF